MKRIGIKYCGGCNPVMDRVKLVQEISRQLPPEFVLEDHQTYNPWDIGILVCGCLTVCADQSEFKDLAREWIIVAGYTVDLNCTPEEKIAESAISKIQNIK